MAMLQHDRWRGLLRVLLAMLAMALLASACGDTDDGTTGAADDDSPAEEEPEDDTGAETEEPEDEPEEEPAENGDVSFEGETVRVLISQSPGGGFDTYARMLAGAIGNYLPGNPDVIAENMPGGAAVVMSNFLTHQSPRDGTEFGTFLPGVALGAVVDQEGNEFDPHAVNWLGTPLPNVVQCAFRNDLGFETFDDLVESGQTVTVSSTGFGGNTYYVPAILAEYGYGDFDIVIGYEGSSEARLAVEQGEADGICAQGVVDTSPEWFEEGGLASVLIQTGDGTETESIEDVPTWQELDVPEEGRSMMAIADALDGIGRAWAMPPEVPDDVVTVVRDAFETAWTEDEDLLAQAEQGGFPIDFRDHTFTENHVDSITSVEEDQLPLIMKLFYGEES